MVIGIFVQSGHETAGEDRAAHLPDFIRGHVPQLPGPQLRITEFLDQGRLHRPVLPAGYHLGEDILYDGSDRQTLGALGAPVRRDLAGMASPEILGVVFKKHGIQFAAKAVDIEIFQRIFPALVDHGSQITAARLDRIDKSHIDKGFRLKGYGIIKKFLFKINTGNPVAPQHHPVFLLRVRAAGGKRHLAVQYDIVISRRTLQGKHVVPPCIYFGHFGEKTVAAHIHAVALIVDGLGDAAHGLALFQDGNLVIAALF